MHKVDTLIIPSSVTSIEHCIYNQNYLVEVVNESKCELPFNNVINEFSSLSDYSSNIVDEGYLKMVYSLSENRYYLYDTTIQDYTTYDITIPGSYNHKEIVIGNGALAEKYFNDLVLEEGIKEIKTNGLYNIRVMGTLTLPNSLEKVNSYATYVNCVNINLPLLSNLIEGSICVREIKNIYYNGTKEQYLTNVVQLGEDTSEVLKLEMDNANLYTLENNQYELATSFDLSSRNITAIPKNAFYKITSITDITLPSTITKIGDYAFYNCENFVRINLPEGVTEIGYSAFENTNISTITLPSTLITINDYAFDGAGLISIEIPSSVEYLGKRSFAYCDNLTNVVIKEGLEVISDEAFMYCPITYLSLPTSVHTIGKDAFRECALGSIDLSNVNKIDNNAFRNNKNLYTIYLSTNCKSIGNYWITSSYNTNKVSIIYSGTESEFNNNIVKGQYWNSGFDSNNLEILFSQTNN